MDAIRQELEVLNLNTFNAEERKSIGTDGWEEYLRKVLSEDFIIRRANIRFANQNKEEMIQFIATGTPRTRKIEGVVPWCNETLGVVTSVVKMNLPNEQGVEVLRKFQNIKVFKRQADSDWQCVYWQVTEAPVEV